MRYGRTNGVAGVVDFLENISTLSEIANRFDEPSASCSSWFRCTFESPVRRSPEVVCLSETGRHRLLHWSPREVLE